MEALYGYSAMEAKKNIAIITTSWKKKMVIRYGGAKMKNDYGHTRKVNSCFLTFFHSDKDAFC
jgi:hypothetical protein